MAFALDSLTRRLGAAQTPPVSSVSTCEHSYASEHYWFVGTPYRKELRDSDLLPDPDRFWAKVDKSGECWIWTAARNRDGYGIAGVRSPVTRKSHRVAWELAHGQRIPPGMHVLHSCDNPACVNPEHLSTGTRKQNMLDRDARGRTAKGDRSGSRTHPERFPVGEKHHSAKFTDATIRDVRLRRARGERVADIAVSCGVSVPYIYEIVRRAKRRSATDARD